MIRQGRGRWQGLAASHASVDVLHLTRQHREGGYAAYP